MAKRSRRKSAPKDDSQKQQSLTVLLDAGGSEVDAAAVGSAMMAFVALVNEAKEQMAQDQQLLIKARPFAPGSFEIPIELILVSAGLLFEHSPLLEALLEVIRRYFETKVVMNGGDTYSDDGVSITIQGKDVNVGSIAVTLLHPTSRTEAAVSEAFAHLERDATIDGFEIRRPELSTPLVRVSRSEFHHFVREQTLSPPKAEREVLHRTSVTVRSVKFEGKAKWEFIWQGRKISANVVDAAFLDRVQAGVESFTAGDRLVVELKIHQKLETATRDYIDKAYEITRVWEHQPREEQQELFDDE
jgi:hypothetical protein